VLHPPAFRLVQLRRPAPAKGKSSQPSASTDDPVRLYLREMGSVELLSREGEIAIAKRIEAGREAVIAGLCESPLIGDVALPKRSVSGLVSRQIVNSLIIGRRFAFGTLSFAPRNLFFLLSLFFLAPCACCSLSFGPVSTVVWLKWHRILMERVVIMPDSHKYVVVRNFACPCSWKWWPRRIHSCLGG
jgi:Sigma-70 factor, region 1.2